MFTNIPEVRRTPKELLAQYTLEANLRDLFLEGVTDKTIVELFLEKFHLKDVVCYDISCLNFDGYAPNPTDLYSNRDKLVLLDSLLAKEFDPNNLKVRCVIDKDFDDLIREYEYNGFILQSDFSSIEGYIMDSRIVAKILNLGFNNFPIQAQTVLDEILKVCFEIFLVRCARIVLKCKEIKLIDIEKSCTVHKNGSIDFEISDYISKLCNKNPMIRNEQDSFMEVIQRLRGDGSGDLRNFVHGHDFMKLFFKYVKSIKNTAGFKDETFEKALYMSIEISDLENFLLFQNLQRLYGI